MGKYHEQADVERLFRQVKVTFTENSAVTATDLAALIDETETYVDSRIKTKYALPVTSAGGLAVLKEICTLLTAAKVWRILNQASQTGSNVGNDWEKSGEKKLDQITAGKLALDDNVPGAGGRDGSGLSSGTTDLDPIWERDTDQW